jgi:hypothetical protein
MLEVGATPVASPVFWCRACGTIKLGDTTTAKPHVVDRAHSLLFHVDKLFMHDRRCGSRAFLRAWEELCWTVGDQRMRDHWRHATG